MNALASQEIHGNWATLICPWNDDESLDTHRLSAEIKAMIGFGVDGIYSNGTAGEFHTQSENEFDRISGILAMHCNAAGMPFQIGVSHPVAQTMLARVERIAELAPSAIQIILPDWFPVTDQEAVHFLKRIAAAAEGIGLVLYNPPHAKRRLTPADLTLLSTAVPELVGVKVPGGDDAWYEAMQPVFKRLSVFVPGHHLASGFSNGAHGAYSNVACLHPGAAQHWWNRMQYDLTGALELESRIRRFMDGHIAPFITAQKYCNGACDRLMANIGGWADVGPHMRWPYRSIPTPEIFRLREIVRNILPEFAVGLV